MSFPRWRELLEGYRWLWSAQVRWTRRRRWLLPLRYLASVLADVGHASVAFLRGRMMTIGRGRHLTVGMIARRAALALVVAVLAMLLFVPRPSDPGIDPQDIVEAPAPRALRQVSPAPSGPQEMTVDITVWPYDVDPSSSVVSLPPSTYLWVLPKNRGGREIEGDERMTVVLSDSTYHENGAGGFWPLIVRMPLEHAVDLRAALERGIAQKGADWGSQRGMESLLAVGMYGLDTSRHVRLIGDAMWDVLPERPGAPWEAGLQTDRRLHLVLWDAGSASWPVVVRLDEPSARKFVADLDDMIREKMSQV